MMRRFSVKLLLITTFAMLLPAFAQEAKPDPRELLRAARVAQANMDWKFTGHLRSGSSSKKDPFLLTVSNGLVKYDFQQGGESIALRLGAQGTTLEEIKGGKSERIGPSRYAQLVRDTVISYEDLTFRFLYWTNARLVGDETIATRDSWVVEILPPGQGTSQYASVKVWLAKADNALMKMEAYDSSGRQIRKYVVRSFMKRDDYWFLKQMDITGPGSRRPTVLTLDDVVR
jgi:hypothetical protein